MQCKGVKEKASICVIWQYKGSCIAEDKGYAVLGSLAFTIYDGTFIQTFIVFDADRMAPRLISQKYANAPLATTIIDEGILFRNITTIGKAFKNCRLYTSTLWTNMWCYW